MKLFMTIAMLVLFVLAPRLAEAHGASIEAISSTNIRALESSTNTRVFSRINAGTRGLRALDGRWHYLVDLHITESDQAGPATVKLLVDRMANKYGFLATKQFDQIIPGFSAFLTEEQVALISGDSAVRLITLDQQLTFSVNEDLRGSIFSEVKAGLSTISWGTNGMVGSAATSSNGTVVTYVVDAGIGQHSDLNVIKRINGVDSGIVWPGTSDIGKTVGCYSHATHVAGIIGGKIGGNGTTVGVLPNAKLISVSVIGEEHYRSQPSYKCLDETYADVMSGLQGALDVVRQDIPLTSPNRAAVVNISMNDPFGNNIFSSTGAIGSRIKLLATPTVGYPGAFIAQSAGNVFKSAYAYAYRPNALADGIMVVGAINSHGQPVVPLNGYDGFRNWRDGETNPAASNEAGSNYGSTVEVWAPGRSIISSFVPWPQKGNVQYGSSGYLSGTSMAAPHVAGFAARIAEEQSLLTPAAIENAVRAKFRNLGTTDPAGTAMRIPASAPLSSTAVSYSEIVISGQPIVPCVGPGCPDDSYNAIINRKFSAVPGQQVWISLDSYGAGGACQVWSYTSWPNAAESNATSIIGGEGVHSIIAQLATPFLSSKNCKGGVIKIEYP